MQEPPATVAHTAAPGMAAQATVAAITAQVTAVVHMAVVVMAVVVMGAAACMAQAHMAAAVCMEVPRCMADQLDPPCMAAVMVEVTAVITGVGMEQVPCRSMGLDTGPAWEGGMGQAWGWGQ